MTDPETEIVAVRRFWRELGLPGLIDVHTHFMPDNVLRKVWAYFDSVGHRSGREWPIQYRLPERERLRRLRAFGALRFTSMLYPHKPEMAQWLNEWSAQFAAAVPDCLRTATFFPERGAAGYVAAEIEQGTRVFKSHLQVGGYDPRDPLLDGVWGALADSATPVVMHCGSGPEPGPYTGPGPIGEVLARHPRLPVIVAHMGMPEYREFLDLAQRFPQVRLDTTMAFTEYVSEAMPFPQQERARLAELGEKILLGTDFPNIPYPYLEQLSALRRLAEQSPELGEDWLRGVLFHNAAELFGIDA